MDCFDADHLSYWMLGFIAVGVMRMILLSIHRLARRDILPYPMRERLDVSQNIKIIFPSMFWRWANLATSVLWVAVELPRVLEDLPYDCLGDHLLARLAPSQAAYVIVAMGSLLLLNGVLALWAWQYYHGVHLMYLTHLTGDMSAHFFSACPPEAYLSELQQTELIMAAADFCCVQLPTFYLMLSPLLFESMPGILADLSFAGHLNLFTTLTTYIMNLWLFAFRASTVDGYRVHYGGYANLLMCHDFRLGEFLCYLLAWPLHFARLVMLFPPALALIASGFKPKYMTAKHFPRFTHHRYPGFGHNDALAHVLDACCFPGYWYIFGEVANLHVPSLPMVAGMINSYTGTAASATGLTAAELSAWPRRKISEIEEADRICCICLQGFERGEEVLSFSCPHTQHEDCILPWLRSKLRCPECRTPIQKPAPASPENQNTEQAAGESRLRPAVVGNRTEEDV